MACRAQVRGSQGVWCAGQARPGRLQSTGWQGEVPEARQLGGRYTPVLGPALAASKHRPQPRGRGPPLPPQSKALSPRYCSKALLALTETTAPRPSRMYSPARLGSPSLMTLVLRARLFTAERGGRAGL